MDDDNGKADLLIRLISGKRFDTTHQTFAACCEWITNWPAKLGEAKRRLLLQTICATYGITEDELYCRIGEVRLPVRSATAIDDEDRLEAALPKGGWLANYIEYTRYTEAPLSYHVFSSLCCLGASVGRRIWKDKGFFNVWCNYAAVLIGPPGRVMKTSAVDIAKDLIQDRALCPIFADKPTAEAMQKAMGEFGGHYFVYVPEFSVMFGKQSYNEGMTTFIIRMLDSPSHWEAETITGGKRIIDNVAMTILGGSTMSLLSSATPAQVLSSGFLNRFMLIVENDTKRSFPQPRKGPEQCERYLKDTLERLKCYTGEITYTKEANEWFEQWYHARKARMRDVDNEVFAECVQRMPMHLERTAILLHLAEHDDMQVCAACMRTAEVLIDYAEGKVPHIVQAVQKDVRGADVDRIFEQLTKLGGICDHSKLLRRVSSYMDAAAFRRAMGTLTESRRVRAEKRGQVHFYVMEESEDGKHDTAVG